MRIQPDYINVIRELRHKNQHLITNSLCHNLYTEPLWEIDRQLAAMLLQQKMLGNSTHYIWRTQDDRKVRASHAANDDKVFAWDDRPETGYPGEDYGCRCWAEPIGDNQYANQFLITTINDNPDKWTLFDFLFHYVNGNGVTKTLPGIGYFADIINFFENDAIAGDGLPGAYRAVNQQIIDAAISQGEGPVEYGFNRSYEFGNVAVPFGGSIVDGKFDGDARQEEGGYLVINGVMTYEFTDNFSDPFFVIETIQTLSGLTRQETELLVFFIELFSDFDRDFAGTAFLTVGRWQTKFNASVKLP